MTTDTDIDPNCLELLGGTIDTEHVDRLSELVARADGVDGFDDEDDNDDDNKHISSGTCMVCGLEGDVKPLKGTHGVFSNAFTTSGPLDWGDGICYRCAYMAGEMDYRRYHWLATASNGVEVIKERPRLVRVLLDPPEEPWMLQYKDGSDFLTVLNGWIVGQRLNQSRERYQIIVDKQLVNFERERLAEMIDLGQRLRDRDDAISKRALIHGPTAGDLGRYDIRKDEYDQIVGNGSYDGYLGREDWRIAVQLIQ